ncbi:MAG: ABC transporter permease [Verrucomicrobiaceae bacterium]|nr:MAG: ABC transporter permease [Verrucomicrobiaceae bacterium]
MTVTRIEAKTKLSLLDWRGIREYRDLIYYLALRDIQVRYKQTILGVLWVILQPLVPAIVYAILFGAFAKLPSDGQPYLLMVLCGLLPWNIFNNTLARVGSSVVANGNLISKVYFPRLVVPIAALGSVVLDALVAIGVLVVILPFYHVPIGPQILAAPLFLFLALVIGMGVSLIVASLNVYYRDVNYMVPFAVQLWYYATPVVYSSELIPEKWRFLYGLNPAAGFIEGFRWAVIGGTNFTTEMLLVTTGSSIALLLLGLYTFRKVERGFADII